MFIVESGSKQFVTSCAVLKAKWKTVFSSRKVADKVSLRTGHPASIVTPTAADGGRIIYTAAHDESGGGFGNWKAAYNFISSTLQTHVVDILGATVSLKQ